MKLRTKIIWISSIVIFLAIFVSDLILWKICSDAMLGEATQAAFMESSEVKTGFAQFLSQIRGDPGSTEVAYYFKNRRDDYTICVRDGETYCNNTVLCVTELEAQDGASLSDFTYFKYSAVGRDLIVFHMLVSGNFELYHIVDVSHVYDRIHMLAGLMLCISAVVLGVSITVIFFMMKLALHPLKELSAGARSIAAGAYDRRVTVNHNDEIGLLGKDFNTMAEAIQRHMTELKALEERKTLFMGDLTHELKTPLTAISGYAQTLRTVALSEDDKEEALRYIYEESKRLDRLSKKMMRLLELDRETELTFTDVHIRDLFAASARTCAVSAAEKNITIEIGECDGTVSADFDLMCDVLINLIDNAVKASPDHSVIKLYSSEDGAITVQDLGCGIPAEEIGKITEPFYMVDKSRSRKSGGAGLGLSLSALILNRHDMDLKIESAVGRGTKVTIYKSFKT